VFFSTQEEKDKDVLDLFLRKWEMEMLRMEKLREILVIKTMGKFL
jgi:hypothetical protein